jgi:hypothetical protein
LRIAAHWNNSATVIMAIANSRFKRCGAYNAARLSRLEAI